MNGTRSPSSSLPPKFQLPALPSLSDSLTAGTDIPPPPPSPPPKEPPPPTNRNDSSNVRASSSSLALPSFSVQSPPPHQTIPPPLQSPDPPTALPPTNSSPPLKAPNPIEQSPASSKRPSSVRKFLSLRSLNSFNAKNSPFASPPSKAPQDAPQPRPASPAGASVTSSMHTSLHKKRSSNFWGRRKSSMFTGEVEDAQGEKIMEEENVRPKSREEEERDPSWSPPPTLPELKGLGNKDSRRATGFFGGGDIFRNIR